MTGRPCDVPTGPHTGLSRLYPCGWRCTSHAPKPRTKAPAGSDAHQATNTMTTTEGAAA